MATADPAGVPRVPVLIPAVPVWGWEAWTGFVRIAVQGIHAACHYCDRAPRLVPFYLRRHRHHLLPPPGCPRAGLGSPPSSSMMDLLSLPCGWLAGVANWIQLIFRRYSPGLSASSILKNTGNLTSNVEGAILLVRSADLSRRDTRNLHLPQSKVRLVVNVLYGSDFT